MTTNHPAMFSKPLLEALRLHMGGVKHVHDPFAGTGQILGTFCDELGIDFTGTDIEDWEGDPRVKLGDSTDAGTYPDKEFTIVTSPTYGNGINDHFAPKDNSIRRTYRVGLNKDLHLNNTGRYGVRGGKKSIDKYWQIHNQVLDVWASLSAGGWLNVSDFIHSNKTVPLTDQWCDAIMVREGLIQQRIDIETKRFKYGSNRDRRANSEQWIQFQF